MSQELKAANQNLCNMVTTVVTQIVEQKFRVSEVELKETPADELKFSEHMALILLNGPKLRVFFKMHFAIDSVRNLLKVRFPKEVFSDDRVKDFMKEMCNLVAGKCKTKFGNANLKMGQSLPMGLVGYNEIFFRRDQGKQGFSYRLILGEETMFYSMSVEYLDNEAFELINSVDLLEEPELDDVAFL